MRRTIARLKDRIGFTGVILGYAPEVVLDEAQVGDVLGAKANEETEAHVKNEIQPWADGVLQTVRLTEEGDFTALKYVSRSFHKT